MFEFAIILLIGYCLLKLSAAGLRAIWWLALLLLAASLLDPNSSRYFLSQAFHFLYEVWNRLLFILGF